MAEEEVESELYKDISELKKEFEGVKSKKDISTKDLFEAVQKLSQTITDMLEMFGAAAEQLKQEDKEYELDAKRHELIVSKLDKLIDQNKTIAEGMVAIVEMLKEKVVAPAKEREEYLFRQRPEPKQFAKPMQQEWSMPEPKPFMKPAQQEWPMQEPKQFARPMQQDWPVQEPKHFSKPQQEWPMQEPQRPQPEITPQSLTPPMPSSFPSFPSQMPPMESTLQDLDFPEFPEEPKAPAEEQQPQKKKLFGIFKK